MLNEALKLYSWWVLYRKLLHKKSLTNIILLLLMSWRALQFITMYLWHHAYQCLCKKFPVMATFLYSYIVVLPINDKTRLLEQLLPNVILETQKNLCEIAASMSLRLTLCGLVVDMLWVTGSVPRALGVVAPSIFGGGDCILAYESCRRGHWVLKKRLILVFHIA